MKNVMSILGTCLFSSLLITSCSNDLLEVEPLDELSQDAVWNDPLLAQDFVNGIYLKLDNPFRKYMTAIYVDEAHRRENSSVLNFNNSQITADGLEGWTGGNGPNKLVWEELYKNIRSCNIFFDNIEGMAFDDAALKERMQGEVHFLRAYYYFTLTNLYGGVPLVTKTYALGDTFSIERNSYADCINFIVGECDLASSLLPETQTGDNNGRVTKGAALSLKARALLHAASDLHKPNVFSDYSNPELLGYTQGSETQRWTDAKNAAKAVIDLGIYSLYKGNPSPNDSISRNYTELFLSKDTEEDIWNRYFTPNTTDYVNNILLLNQPNGYHCQGNNIPLGELVDAFEMADGTKFNWENPDHATRPYQNRDPRFYANILYEGANWGVRPEDVIDIDPLGIIQVGTWQVWNSNENVIEEVYGLDSRKGPIEDWNSGHTGYYCRKFLDMDLRGQFDIQDVPYRYFRYAEILLNYAEACIELGEDDEARNTLNIIRKRVGMPNITESGEALRERYRNERRIELMYEEHRFWDVRRWLIGPEAYAPVHGVKVLYELRPDKTTAKVPTITPFLLEDRSWDDKFYFFPIMRDELNRNEELVQNPGY